MLHVGILFLDFCYQECKIHGLHLIESLVIPSLILKESTTWLYLYTWIFFPDSELGILINCQSHFISYLYIVEDNKSTITTQFLVTIV